MSLVRARQREERVPVSPTPVGGRVEPTAYVLCAHQARLQERDHPKSLSFVASFRRPAKSEADCGKMAAQAAGSVLNGRVAKKGWEIS